MKKSIAYAVMFLAGIPLLISFSRHTAPAESADKIFVHGKIITVDSSNTIAEAVAVKDGKILAVGSSKEILKLKGSQTEVVDLAGKTLIPGLVDGHSHFMSLGRDNIADLNPPPVGGVKNIADIITALQKFKTDKHLSDTDWITGAGYDQEQLAELRHPTKEDLDAAFPTNPVVISHVSGHMVIANSAALRISGIDASTPNPPGGVIVRKPGSNEPAGLLQEHASGLLKRRGGGRGKLTLDQQLEQIKKEEDLYASFGITTAQDGYTSVESLQLLKKAAAQNALYIDIETLPGYATLDKVLNNPDYQFGVLQNHLKLEGFKLIADGSPQGKTAYFSQPYLTDVPGCEGDECRGVPTVTQDEFNAAILKGYKNNIQTFVHCNGDATIDMYIKAVNYADSALGTSSNGRRSVIIHSQFARADQLDSYKSLGMVPSFFTNHTFFWGDVHVKNLGEKRGFYESPLKSALKKGIVFANHTDYPVTPINQMFLLWSSVARESRSGKIIGPENRLTVAEGLRAITINGAYLYYEEKSKGSIEKGKLADFAILSADPLTIPTVKIKDISVLETIKEGKTIYKRN
jgi:predicted amidohydrolase YtcJ